MGELLLCTNEKIGPTLSAEMVAALDRGGGGLAPPSRRGEKEHG